MQVYVKKIDKKAKYFASCRFNNQIAFISKTPKFRKFDLKLFVKNTNNLTEIPLFNLHIYAKMYGSIHSF